MVKDQVVTITFFHFRGASNKWWAFTQMGSLPPLSSLIPEVSFSKLLGSGARDGFSIFPNLNVYALLSVWDNEQVARNFFEDHKVYTNFKSKSDEQWTVFMKNTMSHGKWDGQNPFINTKEQKENSLVAVLTRATIKTKFLWRFWRLVPSVSRSVQEKEGRIFSVGIGELPLVQQATFSLWKNSRSMMDYAYKSHYHKEVIQKTRALGWYKEELFARFEPFDSIGSWNGRLPLQQFLGNLKLSAN